MWTAISITGRRGHAREPGEQAAYYDEIAVRLHLHPKLKRIDELHDKVLGILGRPARTT